MLCSSELFNNISNFTVLDNDDSDHFPIACSIILQTEAENSVAYGHKMKCELFPFKHFKWKPEHLDNFKARFHQLFNSFCQTLPDSTTVLPLLDVFNGIFESAADCMKRTATTFTSFDSFNSVYRRSHWWDRDCTNAKRLKKNSLKRYRLTGYRVDLDLYKKNRNSYKLVCRTKKLQAMTKRRAKLIGCRNDARKFWSLLKSVNDTSEGLVPVPPVVFLDHFKSLLNRISSGEILDSSFLNNVVQRHDCPEVNRPITDQEIVSSIKSLNINKAPGPDGICLEMYKHTVNEILPVLFKLFNEIFDGCDFPEQWSRSIILPIHEKGNLKDPDNYRGISLMDSICKIFMHVLNTRLIEWCDFNNVIDEAQAGFRKKYSTTDNIFVLMSLVKKYLTKKRGRFYCIFIDFSKAFDSIRHDKLWESMERKELVEII